ncbi:acyltransferase domain-containing protein [Streptomyces sp. MS1.AVA.1]|uniref:Acyltransferase domain-containing protein n=1 Tax=Streptomyces machairae TaxID=3134109 RepID=A0ABU8UUV2_9ACTN
MTGQTSRPRLLTLSAPTFTALERATDELATRLESLGDTGFTELPELPDAQVPVGSLRRAIAAGTAAEAARRLRKRDPRRVFTGGPGTRTSRVFLFSGVGDQYPRLGAGLYRRLPEFRRELDRCFGFLAAEHDLDLRAVLFPPETSAGPGDGRPDLAALFDQRETTQEIHRTVVAQPLMFTLQYALARALGTLGAQPSAVAGYSVGEYAAACVAGVFPLEDALRLVTRRAQLVDELPTGAMLAVVAGPGAVAPYVGGQVSLAALNGPEQSVLSGPVEAIEKTARRLTAAGVACRRLATSHAFHSTMTEPVTGPLEELLSTLPLRPPDIPVLSNVTGTWLREEEATSPAYWARHLSRTIRFADGVAELWRLADPLLVELGPGQTLSRLALQHPSRPADAAAPVVQTLPGQFESRTEQELLLAAVGQLWTAGLEIDWHGLRQE